jgi:hypothetical protein
VASSPRKRAGMVSRPLSSIVCKNSPKNMNLIYLRGWPTSPSTWPGTLTQL